MSAREVNNSHAAQRAARVGMTEGWNRWTARRVGETLTCHESEVFAEYLFTQGLDALAKDVESGHADYDNAQEIDHDE